MKILSVDDKVENLYLLEAMLKGAGYQVVSAHNGVEALQQLGHDKFDLIISDILMPQMDGFELCHRVKQSQDLRHIPFIFYTATYTEKKDEELGLRLGASRFTIKPLEPEQFLATVRQVVREDETGRLASAPPPAEEEEVLLKAYNLRLVINNLVSNALKFIPPGVPPQIRIWAEERNTGQGNVSMQHVPAVRLWVADNGIGIAPEHLGKIFGAFERLHGKHAYPGTGLGLTIVRKGAERIGGRVGVESEPGEGSRFWLELTRAES